jgi:membrane protease YdiL (CAAX protease family)
LNSSAPSSEKPPGSGALLRFFVTLFLGAMVLGPLFYFALLGHVPFHRAMNRALMISALAALAVAGPGIKLRDWWPLRRGAIGQVLLGLLIAFVSVQTILGLEVGFGGLMWATNTPHDRLRIMAAALVAALLVPPAEETIFRGFLQTEISRRLGLRAGWIVAAIIFALAHFIKVPAEPGHPPVHVWSGVTAVGQAFMPVLQGDFLCGRGLNLLLIGLILGGIFWRTGMLWINYGLHGGWIVAMLLASGLTRPAPTVSVWTGGDLLSSPLTSLVLVLLGFWLWLFFRRPSPEPEPGANAP